MSTLPIGTVVFENVSKRYRLGALGTLREIVGSLQSRGRTEDPNRTLWALRNVSFRVAPSEALGLIGPNGAGKTTTLKLLSNITQPTSGRVHISGRISSLIELGAGFHPELTGRENIYLNGAILGLKRREIDRKFDDIVAFSELERFLDTPVKRYSSGMYVRLAFAVAVYTEPDVLLVDEVLAVGDASFRHRCMERMRALRAAGTTLVFVSHNMHQVRDICDSAILLVAGQVQSRGEPADLIVEYENQILNTEKWQPFTGPDHTASLVEHTMVLPNVEISPSNGDVLSSHVGARLNIHYRTAGVQPVGRIDVRIVRQDGTLCSAIDSTSESDLRSLRGQGVIGISYDPLQLSAGEYMAVVRITDPTDTTVIASGQSQPFRVFSKHIIPEPGVYVPQVRWNIGVSPAS